MVRISKPGTSTGRKVLSVNKRPFLLLLIIFTLVSGACSRGVYVSALDLTATAQMEHAENIPKPATEEVVPFYTEVPAVLETPQPTTEQAPIGGALTEGVAEDLTETAEVIEPSLTPTRNQTPQPPFVYYTQAGDTLPVVAARFGVNVEEIQFNTDVPVAGLINPGTLLLIPNVLSELIAVDPVMPDSEVVYSPSALDFDIDAFIQDAGGYLSTYREYVIDDWYNAGDVIRKVATEDSINPRLLIALLEYQSHWVYGQPGNLAEEKYPLGFVAAEKDGLYKQLSLAVQQLSAGYYGWREGRLTHLTFTDDTNFRIAPSLNAGSVAVQVFFANFYDQERWLGALYGTDGITLLYEEMFGSPWVRAQTIEPLYPTHLTQPEMNLPFYTGKLWSYTGGPHPAWGPMGAWAALDFAPATTEHGCYDSTEWVVSMTPGLVVRTGNGVVVVDLDGDGYEQTGWVLLYLHIASDDKVLAGAWLDVDQRIGHPSCEGGSATGTHVHIARKYNGEWIAADGPLPFVLSGWTAHRDEKAYEGTLTKDGDTVTARNYGSFETQITR